MRGGSEGGGSVAGGGSVGVVAGGGSVGVVAGRQATSWHSAGGAGGGVDSVTVCVVAGGAGGGGGAGCAGGWLGAAGGLGACSVEPLCVTVTGAAEWRCTTRRCLTGGSTCSVWPPSRTVSRRWRLRWPAWRGAR